MRTLLSLLTLWCVTGYVTWLLLVSAIEMIAVVSNKHRDKTDTINFINDKSHELVSILCRPTEVVVAILKGPYFTFQVISILVDVIMDK